MLHEQMIFVSIRVYSWFYYFPFRAFRGSQPQWTGAPTRAIHALPSPFFSLLPTFYSNPEKMHYIL